MKTVVQKWGNSLAVRIPRTIAEHIRVKEGTPVEVREDGDAVIIRLAVAKASLKELLAGIRPGNLHRETRTGPQTGREVW